MDATEHFVILFNAMPDDVNAAMRAGRRQCVDGAFKAVEGMRRAVHGDLKGFVVVVSAGFASSHGILASRCQVLMATQPRTSRASSGRGPIVPAPKELARNVIPQSCPHFTKCCFRSTSRSRARAGPSARPKS